jgi:hypothetical protein
MNLAKTLLIPALLAFGLSGCVASRTHLGTDFGAAVNQDRLAQIADPDARYPQAVITDGARLGLAMKRYQTGTTIAPSDTGASSVYKGGQAPGAGLGAGPK